MEPKISVLSSADPSHVSTTCASTGLSEAEFARLQAASTAAKATAYCPYSNFRVGAAVLTGDGSLVSGANVENASYPVGTCAERVALARAVTDGHRVFKAVAVTTDLESACSPCGMCRQFIREFCDLTVPILMFDKNANFVVMTIQELLPLSFGPDALDKHRRS